MFTKLYIKNYKAWGEQLWKDGVELAPITLVLGPNSAGKTSLLQPLLLMQQTFNSPDRTQDLNLGGKKTDVLDLGTYEQIVHGQDTSEELGLGVEIAQIDPGFIRISGLRARSLVYRVAYRFSSRTLHLSRMAMSGGDFSASAERRPKGTYALRLRDESNAIDREMPPQRGLKPVRSLAFPLDGRPSPEALNSEVHGCSLALLKYVEAIRYLGPLRDPPRATYLWGGQAPGQIGPRGEDAVAALLANLNAATKADRGTLIAEVSRWLAVMGVADSVYLEQVGKSRFYEVMVRTGAAKSNLIHVGFGVSQVLPMIVLALTAPEGSTVIAEQPEIHLHPRAQSELANLIVETSKKRKLQFLIETHSEHMFRRLQYLIANETLAAEDCRLYFVDRAAQGEPSLERLAVDTFGRVKNWPKHFFGDAVGETERQMRAMIERRRADAQVAGEHGGA